MLNSKLTVTMKKYIFLSLLFFAFSCSEEEVHTYVGDSQLFFSYADASINTPVDSTFVLFGYAESEQTVDSIISIPVQVSGLPVGVDRSFKYEIVDTLTTAALGEDYELLESHIEANSLFGFARIKLNRTEKLKKNTLSIGIKLLPNDNFKTDYVRIFNPNASEADIERMNPNVYRLFINDMISKPLGWILFESRFKMFFGEFSQVKYQLILEVCKLNDDFFQFDTLAVYNERFPTTLLMKWTAMVNSALVRYEKENGQKLVDENDIVVELNMKNVDE